MGDKMVSKDGKLRFGFGVNDCPLWLFKRLDREAKACFNDQYWVVLNEWCRKAEAYDKWMQGAEVASEELPVQEEVVIKEKDESAGLFGGHKIEKR